MPVKHAVYEPLLPLAAVTGDGAWSPSVDVRELPDEYIVLADLPGVEPGAVDVTSEGDTLTFAGARRDRLRAGGVPIRLERPTGKLRRSVQLPGPHNRTELSTQIRDGVLEIRVPKAARPSNSRARETTPAAPDPLKARRRGRTKVAPVRETRRSATTREAREPRATARNLA